VGWKDEWRGSRKVNMVDVILYLYGNRTMRVVKTILSRREGNEGE
jgi:hypothetical protein